MIVHQVYAMIHQEEIRNVFVCDNYEMANFLARATYGDDAFAVDCLQFPCFIGCKYKDNTFYEMDGTTAIKYVPTQEQQMQQLSTENKDLHLSLTKLHKKNLAMQKEVTNTQVALTELYEGMEV